MTRAIDNTNGVWATGTPNYAAGIHPWSGTTTVSAPAYNYFTPNFPPAAQEFNSLFNSLTFAYDALVKWTAVSATLATPADLTAMTDTVVDGETRYVPQFGLYRYNSLSGSSVDGVNRVAGHLGGLTRWILADADTRTPLLWDKQQGVYQGSALTLTGSFDTTDPAARAGGNVGRAIVGALSFVTLVNDIFEISYSVGFGLGTTDTSDVVTGVRYDTATYIAASIDDGAQVSGAHTNGVLYDASVANVRATITRTFYWVSTVAGTKTFQLDAACDTQKHGLILQGSMLSIKQYRPVS